MSYIVKAGDSLTSIAQKELGDIALWQYLASINQIASPYVLYPGEILIIDVPTITTSKMNKNIMYAAGAIAAGVAIYFLTKKSKKKSSALGDLDTAKTKKGKIKQRAAVFAKLSEEEKLFPKNRSGVRKKKTKKRAR